MSAEMSDWLNGPVFSSTLQKLKLKYKFLYSLGVTQGKLCVWVRSFSFFSFLSQRLVKSHWLQSFTLPALARKVISSMESVLEISQSETNNRESSGDLPRVLQTFQWTVKLCTLSLWEVAVCLTFELTNTLIWSMI